MGDDRHLLLLVAHTVAEDDEAGQPVEVIHIISARRSTGRKGDVMKKEADIVRFAVEIDYSDISPVAESFWHTAERGRFYKPIKQQITARVDADVLAWFKSQGKGYQARINAILRREMLSAVKGEHASR